jgi:hypothetical protein
MGCEHEGGGGFYRPRKPKETAFYRLVQRFYPEFEAVYAERYQECYGFWRPAIAASETGAADRPVGQPGSLRAGSAPPVRLHHPQTAADLFPVRPSNVGRTLPMIEVTGRGQVFYKTGDNRLGRFPEAASDDLMAGPKRNFQVFDPLDFLAEVTQHNHFDRLIEQVSVLNGEVRAHSERKTERLPSECRVERE